MDHREENQWELSMIQVVVAVVPENSSIVIHDVLVIGVSFHPEVELPTA